MEASDVTELDATHLKLIEKLEGKGVEYKITEHEPVKTSEEAAKVRGVSLDSGAKAMFCVDFSRKLDPIYFLAVISASRKINWKQFRGIIGTKKVKLVALEKV